MKIAKIFVGNPENQKGYFNNVIERTRNLKKVEPDVDCYMVRIRFSWFVRFLKGQFGNEQKERFIEVEGITFTNIWITLGIIDYLVTHKLCLKASVGCRQLRNFSSLFSGYDVLSVHGFEAVYLAQKVKEEFDVPYVATWHGSDINYRAFKNKLIERQAEFFLENANHNFFVSKALLVKASLISEIAKKSVLYTGPSKFFYRYDEETRNAVKSRYGLNAKHIIGYIGNFVPVKNVLILPELFKNLQCVFDNIEFVLVGGGSLESKIKERIDYFGVKNVHFLGQFEPRDVPHILNCIDVLVLPSINEGLPRITLEAQACGVHVVGSSCGGIPEAIGAENCFDLGKEFVSSMTEKVVYLLKDSTQEVALSDCFSWEHALAHEKDIHDNIAVL